MTLPPYQRQGYGRLLIDFSKLNSFNCETLVTVNSFRLPFNSDGRKNWFTWEAPLRSGFDLVPLLLEGHSIGAYVFVPGKRNLNQRPEPRDGYKCLRHSQHSAGDWHDEVLERKAYCVEKEGRYRGIPGEGKAPRARLATHWPQVFKMAPVRRTSRNAAVRFFRASTHVSTYCV